MRAIAPLILILAATVAHAQGAPVVVVEASILDSGVVPSGTQLNETFVLENRGGSTLEILAVEPDCGCTVVRYDASIRPGGRGELAARVDVSTFVGPIAKYITVRTNDPANPELTLTIKAQIRPIVQVYPGYARFLTVRGSGEMDAEQTLWSATSDDFEVKSVRSPYEHLEVSFHEADEDEERTEGQGRQWVVDMTLAADAPVGPMAEYVTVETNHPEKPMVRIPVSGFVRPVLGVSPPFADFGTRELTRSIFATVHLKNFSEDEIAILEATADLPQLEVEIDPDGRDNYVVIRLHPGLDKGDFNGLVTVKTNSAAIPVVEIEVKGTIL